jgi:hypothetical protein
MFASDVFDSQYVHVKMDLFPDHHQLLQNLLGEEAQLEVARNPGTFEALVVMVIWIIGHEGQVPPPSKKEGAEVNIMLYHHLLTLISVFHTNVRVRNASTVIAGQVLHQDPDEDDRLAILEDLVENCIFSSLQAAAVTWLREELISAQKAKSADQPAGRFARTDCLEKLQYTLFPDLTSLKDATPDALWEFWTQNSPFHMQVANFALFLFGGSGYKQLAPAGMAAAVEHRYADPLRDATTRLAKALESKELDQGSASAEVQTQLAILTNTLQDVPLH